MLMFASRDVSSGHEVWWTVTTNPLIDGSIAKGIISLNQQGSIRPGGTCSSESKFPFKGPSELDFSTKLLEEEKEPVKTQL